MTTFSPITGYGLTPETIGAAPTATSPLVGSALVGAEYGAPLPPDPVGGGALPNAGVPTGYDAAGAYLVDGAGNYIQPPVDDMGVVGPVSAATATAGGPTASGWNADYGTAFARAFTNAGVNPSVASAALHALAANAPTTPELEEALQYLSTQEGIELAPYLAENLAKSAPSYAAMGDVSGGATDYGIPSDPTAYPPDSTAYPADPTGLPPNGAQPSATGGLEIVGQNEDGTYVLSDGRTIVGQTEDGSLVVDDGSVLDQEGNEIAPAGTVPVGGSSRAPRGEVDPTTGKPVDPTAAPAGEEARKTDDGGLGVPSLLLGSAGLGTGLAMYIAKKKHNTFNPLAAFRRNPVPATPVDAGRTTTPHPSTPVAYETATKRPIVAGEITPGEVKVQRMPDGLRRLMGGEALPAAAASNPTPATTHPATTPAARPAAAKPQRITFNGQPLFEPSAGGPRRGATRAAGAPGAHIPIIKHPAPPAAVEAALQRSAREMAEGATRSAGETGARLLRFASKL